MISSPFDLSSDPFMIKIGRLAYWKGKKIVTIFCWRSFYTVREHETRMQCSHWIDWLHLNDVVYTKGECGRISVRADCLQSEFLGKDRANDFH
jgi:hypothetical protein